MYNFAIIYGTAQNGIQKKAVEILSTFLLDYTFEYPICLEYDSDADYSRYRCIYIGTKESNTYIKEHSSVCLDKEEGYFIQVKDNTVVIEGYDDKGVLYGCVDFYNKYLLKCEYASKIDFDFPDLLGNPFEDFELKSSPMIQNRGIWTWGHVIYDYKGFIDNMVKLKMNTLIMWNDHVPFHAKDIIEYAHSCGVKVIFGFAWCWDVDCKLYNLQTIKEQSPLILKKFQEEYASLGVDGIYFQSFTELKEEEINGILVAEAVTDFVNHTASLIYEKYPELELQFGLHATSVKEKLEYIKHVDPRIKIVWEDCGAFPFHYSPKHIEGHEETNELVKTIAHLRGEDDRFAVVTKGFTKLDWGQFEHLEGPVHFGVSSKFMKENRIIRKRRLWKYLQAYWITNAGTAYETVKVLQKSKNGNLDVTSLVEDGMFEENIMFPVALYAEMLWDCKGELCDMINQVALRSYVDFV